MVGTAIPLHDSRKIAHSVIRKNISQKGWEDSEKPSFLKAIFIIVDERNESKRNPKICLKVNKKSLVFEI